MKEYELSSLEELNSVDIPEKAKHYIRTIASLISYYESELEFKFYDLDFSMIIKGEGDDFCTFQVKNLDVKVHSYDANGDPQDTEIFIVLKETKT